jgi:hypothetical protein
MSGWIANERVLEEKRELLKLENDTKDGRRIGDLEDRGNDAVQCL